MKTTQPKSKEITQQIIIEPIEVATIKVAIKGETPLLMHKFSDNQKNTMLDKQTGKNPKDKAKRDMKKEMEECVYYTPTGKVGFPASGFKKAMVEAAPYMKGLDKKLIKGSLFIIENLVEIKYKKRTVNEAICRLANKVPMVRHRPEFTDWTTELTIRFNSKQLTAEQIFNLIKLAGFHIGVGDWRPQCNGSYGQFTIANKQKMAE